MTLTTLKGLNSKVDFLKISEDSFWNDVTEPEIRMHKLHVYPAKFPSLIAKRAFEYAKGKVKLNTVADIFCGCGTVAVEAKRKGVNFWGCDINPVAVLISQAKSERYSIKAVQNIETAIIAYFERNVAAANYLNANTRLQYWFCENQYSDLAKLKTAIEAETDDDKYRILFLCIFSSILKGTSKWLTKSIKPQIDPKKKPAGVLEMFKSQVAVAMKAITEAAYPDGPSQVEIVRQNVLEVDKHEFADMIVTSPPYVTSYEYADLHQLSALWLNYADDYTELRQDSIGSSYNIGKGERPEGLTPTASKIVDYFRWDLCQTRSIARYYTDMLRFAEKSYNILRSKGIAVFVIGDTEYGDKHIENAKCLCECMIQSGFIIKEISKRAVVNKLLPSHRDENGKFTSDKSARSIYSQEYVIIGRKG